MLSFTNASTHRPETGGILKSSPSWIERTQNLLSESLRLTTAAKNVFAWKCWNWSIVAWNPKPKCEIIFSICMGGLSNRTQALSGACWTRLKKIAQKFQLLHGLQARQRVRHLPLHGLWHIDIPSFSLSRNLQVGHWLGPLYECLIAISKSSDQHWQN